MTTTSFLLLSPLLLLQPITCTIMSILMMHCYSSSTTTIVTAFLAQTTTVTPRSRWCTSCIARTARTITSSSVITPNNGNGNRTTIKATFSSSSSSTCSNKENNGKESKTIAAHTISPESFPASAYEPRPFFRYELLHQSTKPGSQARVGRIHTPHGIIDTPGFVAVATNGALKGLTFADADASNQQLIFCNSYHLLLQPGPEIIAEAGGLHQYVRRTTDRPFITDSGGFQVFSLAYGSVHEELSSKGELKKSHVNNKHV